MPLKNEFVLTEEQVRVAHKKWCAGSTYNQLAKELFVCRRTLIRAFKRYGLTKSGKVG